MKLVAQATSGLQGKCAAGVHAVKNPLVATSVAARHRRAAFKPARVVRVAAAEPQDGAAPVSSARSGGVIPASDLQEGQEFEGTVLSVQAFGAFVDIGADKDGLVHISQLRSTRVGAVADVVKVGDKVNVKVLGVDLEKGRVALTMKGLNGDVATEAPASNKRAVTVSDSELVEGAVMEGTVTSVAAFGAFVNIGASKDGLVHISELGDGFIQNASDVVNVGDVVTVRVLSYDGTKLALSMKTGEEAEDGDMDISPGDTFEGTVTNSETFGVFVDIGAGRDGLVHVSQIPGDLPAVGDSVSVTVLSYDASSGRIALTMKGDEEDMAVQKGAKFEGRVTKVESFGAFVDIGAGKDGLVHVSQLGDEFVEDASKVVSVGDVVRVKVINTDPKTGRIALTMKNVDSEEVDASAGRIPAASLQKGEVFNGTVTQVSAFGAFVDIGADRDGLVHVSQLNSEERVEDASSMVSVGDSVRVRVMSFDSEKNRLALSMKNVESAGAVAANMDDEDKVAIERADNARAKSELDAFMSSCEPYDDVSRSVKFFTVMADDGEVDEFEANPGHSFVMSEADGDVEDSIESGLFFQMRDDEDMAELSAEALDALEAVNAKDLKIQNDIDVDVPLQALVEGKITAVEATGITVSISYNGATIEGYLAREEAKIPYAKLPAADQAAWATRGALTVPAAAKAILEGVVGPTGASDLKQTPAEYEVAFVDSVDNGTVKAGALLPSEYRSAYNIALLQSEAVDAARLEIAQATAAPAFVDADGLDLTKFYAVGDSITSMVLAYEGYDEVAVSDDSNKVLLTMFADYEVEQEAVAAALAKGDNFSKSVLTSDDLDFSEDETIASAISAQMSLAVDDSNGMDLFGLDPMEMLADEMEANEPGSSSLLFADNGVDASAAKADAAAIAAADAAEGDDDDSMFSVDGAQVADVMSNMKKVGLFYASSGSSAMLNAAAAAGDAFPDRDLDYDAVDIEDLPLEYRRVFHSEGGDMSTLYDFWEDDFVAPKGREYYQKLKMRVVFDENGEGELEEYEDAPEGVELPTASAEEADDLTYVMNPEHDQMVADLVKALLDDAEGEADLPVRAMRMPVVLAADVAISAADVKDLRTKTGAGMMDCKKALKECSGNVEEAMEWLRKKGLSGADKKAGRIAAEGAIISYIHPGSRLGVMVEVNCETDFVAASDAFQKLAKSVAMQLAASPEVQYVSVEDIPAEVFEKEKQIEMGREDLKNKPADIQAKIAEGRALKLAQQMALLPQPYLMDGSKTVEQAVKETIAAVGEKVSIRRFIKFELGEGMEKKSNDFAAEVAAATGSQ